MSGAQPNPAAPRLAATASERGRVALSWDDAPLVGGTALRGRVGAATWAFGEADAEDGAVLHHADGGVTGWRIVRGGLDVRLTFGLPPGGNVAVFRLDATNTGAAPAALVLESQVRAVQGTWEAVAALGARTVQVDAGRYVAHTFVPDDGAMPPADADASSPDASSPEAAPDGLVRAATLAPGETQGWTICVGVGATARAALGAAFPHLSGQRSRAALVAAKAHGRSV